MGLEDKQILITGGIVSVFGIAVVISLLIAPSYSGKDTQFFVTNTVNATNISLNDLTDVFLINTLNKQILVYNSTSNLWENENQTSISANNATCSNLGSGKILCASYSGNNLAFKSLLAGNAITLSNDTNTITITNAGVYRDIAGTGIGVNQTSGSVLITNTLPESTVCNNATSSTGHRGLCKDNTIDLRTLLAGSGISLSLNSTDITITNSGVTSITANSPLSASASTGSITLSCSTCLTVSDIQKLCTNTLGSSGTSISCNSFSAKKNLLVVFDGIVVTNTFESGIQFNSDSGNNYATRRSSNGGADTTSVSSASILPKGSSDSASDRIQIVCFVMNNVAGNYKLTDCHYSNDLNSVGGAGTAPNRIEFVGKWANTSAQITSITINRVSGTGSLNTNTVINVFGWD